MPPGPLSTAQSECYPPPVLPRVLVLAARRVPCWADGRLSVGPDDSWSEPASQRRARVGAQDGGADEQGGHQDSNPSHARAARRPCADPGVDSPFRQFVGSGQETEISQQPRSLSFVWIRGSLAFRLVAVSWLSPLRLLSVSAGLPPWPPDPCERDAAWSKRFSRAHRAMSRSLGRYSLQSRTGPGRASLVTHAGKHLGQHALILLFSSAMAGVALIPTMSMNRSPGRARTVLEPGPGGGNSAPSVWAMR